MNQIKNSCLRKAPTVGDADAAVPYSCSSRFQLKPLDFLGGGNGVPVTVFSGPLRILRIITDPNKDSIPTKTVVMTNVKIGIIL
jgi:hypothetical protein